MCGGDDDDFLRATNNYKLLFAFVIFKVLCSFPLAPKF